MRGRILAASVIGASVILLSVRTSAAPISTVRIAISPSSILDGDSVSIRLTGLMGGSLATIYIQSVSTGDDGKQGPFYSRATYRADSRGSIDLSRAAPIAGYYKGSDLRGLFWSERPIPSATEAALSKQLLPASSITPREWLLSVEAGGTIRARSALTIRSVDPGVHREAVRSGDLVGAFYYKPGTKSRPVIVVLGGSEGGLDVADLIGPLLASRGFAVFGLNYFSPNESAVAGVPTTLTNIPIELLAKARTWLGARSEADISRFGLIGYSKGAEFALVLASEYDWIDAVVAYAPSDYVWQGIRTGPGTPSSSWSRSGHGLPYIPTTGMRQAIQDARRRRTRVSLATVERLDLLTASPQSLEAARIKVERSRAALLLIGGGDDQVSDSGESVNRIGALLSRVAYTKDHLVLEYPNAGHDLIETGWASTMSDNTDFIEDGGTPAADARAQADSWPRMISFLNKELVVGR